MLLASARKLIRGLAIKQDLLLNKTILFLAIYPSGIIACMLGKKRAGNDPPEVAPINRTP
jgi:hypothetical protein